MATLVEATVAKAAYCVDNLEEHRQRNRVLLLLETKEKGKVANNTNRTSTKHFFLLFCIVKRTVADIEKDTFQG